MPLSKPVSFSVTGWSSKLTQVVRNARRARMWHKKWPCAETCSAYLDALNVRGEEIRKTKAVHFKQAIAAARGRRGIWPLAKWAQT
jgi:hypothetical protein